MSLVRWFGQDDVFSSLENMNSEMNRLMSVYKPTSYRRGVFPAMNVYDDGESYIVRAELPGVDPKDITINVTGDTLNVRGKREIEKSGKSSYHRRERDSGTFSRSLTLPDKIDNQKVFAKNKHGILEIVLPRAAEAQARTIKVQAS